MQDPQKNSYFFNRTEIRKVINEMKEPKKDSEKVAWNPIHMRSSSAKPAKIMVWIILFVSAMYVIYTLKLLGDSAEDTYDDLPFGLSLHRSLLDPNRTGVTSRPSLLSRSALNTTSLSNRSTLIPPPPLNRSALNTTSLQRHREAREKQMLELQVQKAPPKPKPTEIHDVVFGIGASSGLWQQRKEYIKIWYRADRMRGYVWLDSRVNYTAEDKRTLPPVKISTDTSRFPYKNPQGHRSAIRISRIVSEMVRMKLENVRWFVMGDDDTVFITDNLVRILRKYDHTQYYYIGSLSESHIQNIFFSYGMAYGGGGFAISYPLAKALSKMQDRCIERYPGLYGSDDRMQACMAELGVPLTKEKGFHQYDVYGNLFGLLAAHPVTPLVSVHHLDVVEPIFPNMTRVQSLKHLTLPTKYDSAGIMQQSICYDKERGWTISVSWGFAVQIFRGIFSPREMEMPSRTFLNWYRRADYTAYSFNTRPVTRNPCQKPFVFYMSNVKLDSKMNTTVSKYERHRIPHPHCKWKMADPNDLHMVIVNKKPDPHLWDRSPRRNCCRVMKSKTKDDTIMKMDVGICKENEVSEIL